MPPQLHALLCIRLQAAITQQGLGGIEATQARIQRLRKRRKVPTQDQSRANAELPVGTQLGDDLVVVGLLGRGGMGRVYRARDQLLEREVAVKVLELDGDADDDAVLRVLQEARAVAQLVHPGIVPLHRAGVGPQGPYLEMALVGGPSLRALLHEARLPAVWVASCVAQLAAALQAAHDRGVVHCDVKPDNILLRHGDLDRTPEPVLVDFGLARCVASGTAGRALSHGTIAYLAPEHAVGPPLPASDQFALAVVAAELLTGQRPERDDWRQALPVPTHLPAPVAAVLRRAGHVDPLQRFADLPAFADALLAALDQRALRPALLGAPPQALGSLTSAAVPIPLAALATQGDADVLLCALVALLPHNLPEALPVAWGGPLPGALVNALRAAGRLHGPPDQLQIAPELREAALAAVSARQLRLVQAAAARAIEATAPQGDGSRLHAQRLWLGARQPAEAARLALQAAWRTGHAGERARQLGRAAALLANPAELLPWLRACVAQLDWQLRCGMCDEAVPALAEAQGLLVEAGLPARHVFALALRRHAAELARWSGRTAAASAQVLRALELATGEERSLLLALAADLDLPPPDGAVAPTERAAAELWPVARHTAACQSSLLAAQSRQAARHGELQRAERLALRGVEAAREAADALAVGEAAVALGAAQLQRGAPNAANQSAQLASEALRPFGPTAAAVALADLQANLHEARGKPWPALAAQLAAAAQRQALGLPPPTGAEAARNRERLERLGGPNALSALQAWPD